MSGSPLLVADLFCGAGGSSTGAAKALRRAGRTMKLVAVNHWSTAVATHSANHPDAAHYCVDVYKTSPREAVPGGRLDLLMASPTCTYHSVARGSKPISADQKYGRMTPTQVLRWITELDVTRIMVENVPEFTGWGPVHMHEPTDARCIATGCVNERPCKRRAGCYFRSWIRKIERLGYKVEYKVVNAADYGDATTRRRFFLLGRKDGKAIRWPEASHAKDPRAGDLFSKPKKRWRAAREIIDWSLSGRSIFDRKKPLSDKTMARIYEGARRFRWPEPFLVILRNNMRTPCTQSTDAPLPTLCSGGNHFGIATPGPRLDGTKVADGPSELPWDTGAPDASFLLSQASGGAPRPTSEPVPTLTTDGAVAFIAPYYGNATPSAVGAPLPTVTTKDRHALVMPVTHTDTSNRARDPEVDPLPAITGAARGELACIVAAFGERPGQTPRVHDVNEPAPTIPATGRIQLAEGVVGAPERAYDIRFRMLEPRELAGAMGFDDYEFCGNKTEVTKQIGNAVPVNTASALVSAILLDAR